MLREYGVDLLDFYRGTLSIRRVAVLVKNLSPESGMARLMAGPVGAEMAAEAQAEAREARISGLRTKYQKLKRRYGLG